MLNKNSLDSAYKIGYNNKHLGDWPSGKAAGSGPVIGGSNPSSPAKQLFATIIVDCGFSLLMVY